MMFTTELFKTLDGVEKAEYVINNITESGLSEESVTEILTKAVVSVRGQQFNERVCASNINKCKNYIGFYRWIRCLIEILDDELPYFESKFTQRELFI